MLTYGENWSTVSV